jgi:hypothetical protein
VRSDLIKGIVSEREASLILEMCCLMCSVMWSSLSE